MDMLAGFNFERIWLVHPLVPASNKVVGPEFGSTRVSMVLPLVDERGIGQGWVDWAERSGVGVVKSSTGSDIRGFLVDVGFVL